jgi:hypothetical protein
LAAQVLLVEPEIQHVAVAQNAGDVAERFPAPDISSCRRLPPAIRKRPEADLSGLIPPGLVTRPLPVLCSSNQEL